MLDTKFQWDRKNKFLVFNGLVYVMVAIIK